MLTAGVLLLILGAVNYFTGTVPTATVTPAAAALGLILVGAGASLKRRGGTG